MSMDTTKPTLADKVDLKTRVSYGFGSVAYGVKDNAFGGFLLIFFSQVIGIPAEKVGLALMIALMFDAVSDPIVGQLSDKTRSKLGRRHPYLYASIVPIGIAFYFLWNPPSSLNADNGFFFVLGMAILVRLCVTFFEVPSTAQIAELTTDYDERTSLLSLRYFFGWIGGTGIAFIAWTFLLVPTEGISHGIMNKAGYGQYGLLAAIVIVIAITISAFGTQRRAKAMTYRPQKEKLNVLTNFKEMGQTLLSPSFRVLFLAAIPGAIALGIISSLATYFNTFFWEFRTEQIGKLIIPAMFAAFSAPIIAPLVARRFGKKSAAVGVSILSVSIGPLPVVLRLLDLFPANGSEALFYSILVFGFFQTNLAITSGILIASMVADVVEENQIRTGRRSEGLLFSVQQFIGKTVTGLGLFAGSLILAGIGFPTGASPGEVPQSILNNLALIYVPSVALFYFIAIYFVTKYKITRGSHNENLQELGL